MLLSALYFFMSSKSYKAEKAKKEQVRIESIENLSAADIENDRNFLENAIAEGIAYVTAWRDEPITRNADDEGDAYVVGSPVPVSCYLLKTEDGNHLCIVYKTTYEFSISKSLKEVYDCLLFENIEQDETGHLSCRYSCNRTSGHGSDDHWLGYDTAEGVYEDKNALPDDYESFKVNF